MDAEVIFSKQLKQIEKEKKDKEMKLKTQEKKVRWWSWLLADLEKKTFSQVDYFIRAQRVVELQQNLIEKEYEMQLAADNEFHQQRETEKVGTIWNVGLHIVCPDV